MPSIQQSKRAIQQSSPLLTAKQAAEYLGVSVWKVDSECHEGRLGYIEFPSAGKRDGPGDWRFEIVELYAYINRHRQKRKA